MLTTTSSLFTTNSLRDAITKAYRMDETACLKLLMPYANLTASQLATTKEVATQFVLGIREYKKKQSHMEALLHQYDLTTDEGIALMCLSEALLRIPDRATTDKFISDKLSSQDWKKHTGGQQSLMMQATAWSLLLTGKVYAPVLDTDDQSLLGSMKRTVGKLGTTVIRPFMMQMMKAMGNQFVIGEDIHSALKRSVSLAKLGYLFSYDMLGEAARTAEDATHYYDAYLQAIRAIGATCQHQDPRRNPGISIKLSALHPRYEFAQYDRVMATVPARLLTLIETAKQYQLGVTIDAEEADRLDLSLDIFEKVFTDPALADWEGLGLAVQAYQKRAPYVIDWLADLAERARKRIFVRLVKGAYWDAEIKVAQYQGMSDYPVYTRKHATDVSYLACAKKLLTKHAHIYPQFATHNAYSVAAILEMAKMLPTANFEFQCLQGMGRSLYDQVVDPKQLNRACRIYAPVGTHKELLGYLVRRLLENGANSSFVNLLADERTPIDKIVTDPVAYIMARDCQRHPNIPLPKDIYGAWQNSAGIDLSDREVLKDLQTSLCAAASGAPVAVSLIGGKPAQTNLTHEVMAPSNLGQVIGRVGEADATDVSRALALATNACAGWAATSVTERATILRTAADLLQTEMPSLLYSIAIEGGRTIPDAIAEVREAIDFCRYYAQRATLDLQVVDLPSVTGEKNQLSLHPRGIIACISPWNFPVAIFTGQIVAALVTGNVVIAKPAEQTPITAYRVVEILHRAGVPGDVLQLLIGPGEVVGAALVADPRVAGVIFTGSTETARHIAKSLADRPGPIVPLIAETGGQNALIVDSSALPEQSVVDIVQSAFNSAGQRCSALRVLFLQEEIAPTMLKMLQGYMAELIVGDPTQLATDVGPVIDSDALRMLNQHFAKMQTVGKLIAQAPLSLSANGYFFAPCAFEIADISVLDREIFGPILHVVKYAARDFDKVLDSIINTGYGLTLGIHSRIDATIQRVSQRMPVGNVYVNRNIIGAVVGVQPFGGERLSGTGPKAGGPHYLPRLCVERAISTNTTAVGGNASLISLLEDKE